MGYNWKDEDDVEVQHCGYGVENTDSKTDDTKIISLHLKHYLTWLPQLNTISSVTLVINE